MVAVKVGINKGLKPTKLEDEFELVHTSDGEFLIFRPQD